MRRLAACLAIPLLFVALPARAQLASPSPAATGVTLRLVGQTRWNDPKHTTVNVEVRAINRGDGTLDGLSLFLGINTATSSRTQFEQSMTTSTGSPLLGNTTVEPGTLASGKRATYRLSQDVSTLANIGRSDIYPMIVQLRSRDVPVATIRTPLLFLARNPPLTPLDLAWSFSLTAPITYQPDGFHSPWLQRELAVGEPLRDEIDAMSAMASARRAPAFDVAIAPQLVSQLTQMGRGYTFFLGDTAHHVARGTGASGEAARALTELRAIVGGKTAETSALPFSSPSLPALITAGLAQDLPEQLAQGRDVVASSLDADPSAGLLHPPGSRLDQASLYALQQSGVHLLLLDGTTVQQQAQENDFAKPAVVGLSTGTDRPMDAVVPDSGVQALLDGDLPHRDPRLAVQVVLGELAQIWLERPSVARGIALTLSERENLPGAFFAPFLSAIRAAPWLHPRKATRFAAAHPPEPSEDVTIRRAAAGPAFPESYLIDLQAARQSIETYSSILPDGDPTTTVALQRLILLAEAGQFVSRTDGGEAFLNGVTATLRREFGGVTPDTSSVVTLTSRRGTIPVPIHNATGKAVRVRVDLEAGGRLTVDHNPRVVTVPPDGTTLTFGVQTETTGRFPVQIQVLTPDGRESLSQGNLVVRSTAYNLVALILTIGAALVLLGLWGRRFLPWRKR